MHCTVRKQGDLCVYSGKVPFRMDEESMVQRLTRIKELNGKLSRPPHYAHGTIRDHTYTTSSKTGWVVQGPLIKDGQNRRDLISWALTLCRIPLAFQK